MQIFEKLPRLSRNRPQAEGEAERVTRICLPVLHSCVGGSK